MSILDRYGLKEVADLTWFHIGADGNPDYPVLYCDTAKVSTTEFTAENSSARGGKGNAELITWDFNKEINVTVEDALFSAKSLAIMLGNGTVAEYGNSAQAEFLMRTETFVATDVTKPTAATSVGDAKIVSGWDQGYTAPNGKRYIKYNPKFFKADGTAADALVKGEKFFCSYDLAVAGSVIEISANSFPGTLIAA